MWRFVGILGVVLGMTTPARSQTIQIPIPCALEDLQEQHLRGKYKEAPVGYGVTSAGSMVELWRSEENDTWTVTLRLPNGYLCVMVSGSGWRELPARMKGVAS